MRVLRTILGMLLLMIGLPSLLAGAGLWAAMQHRDASGAYSGQLQRLATPGYAFVVEDVDRLLRTDAPFARIGSSELGITAATPDGPAFIGVAPSLEVSRYLAGVPHSMISSVDIGTGALPVATTPVIGVRAPEAIPARETFWTRSGTGRLTWQPGEVRGGPYSLVVMNPGAKPGMQLTAAAELRPSWLNPGTWGLLTLGTLLVMVGLLVLAWPARRREIVYVVEPSQVPDLMMAIGAPLPNRPIGAHRPRTLADAHKRTLPGLPPAVPSLAWPPAPPSAAEYAAATALPAASRSGHRAGSGGIGAGSGPAHAASGRSGHGPGVHTVAGRRGNPPSASDYPIAAASAAAPDTFFAPVPAGMFAGPTEAAAPAVPSWPANAAGHGPQDSRSTGWPAAGPSGLWTGGESDAPPVEPYSRPDAAPAGQSFSGPEAAPAGQLFSGPEAAPAGQSSSRAGSAAAGRSSSRPDRGPAGGAAPAPGEPLRFIGANSAAGPVSLPLGDLPSGAVDPLFGRRLDRGGRRRTAEPGDLPPFRSSAVDAWVAETAPIRARETEAQAAARLAEAARNRASMAELSPTAFDAEPVIPSPGAFAGSPSATTGQPVLRDRPLSASTSDQVESAASASDPMESGARDAANSGRPMPTVSGQSASREASSVSVVPQPAAGQSAAGQSAAGQSAAAEPGVAQPASAEPAVPQPVARTAEQLTPAARSATPDIGRAPQPAASAAQPSAAAAQPTTPTAQSTTRAAQSTTRAAQSTTRAAQSATGAAQSATSTAPVAASAAQSTASPQQSPVSGVRPATPGSPSGERGVRPSVHPSEQRVSVVTGPKATDWAATGLTRADSPRIGHPAPTSADRRPAPASADRSLAAASAERRPAPTSTDRRPVPTSAEQRPTAAQAEGRPESASDQRRPAPTSADRRPVPTSAERHPTPAQAEGRPESASDQRRPAPTSADRRPAPTSAERRPAPAPSASDPASARTASEDQPGSAAGEARVDDRGRGANPAAGVPGGSGLRSAVPGPAPRPTPSRAAGPLPTPKHATSPFFGADEHVSNAIGRPSAGPGRAPVVPARPSGSTSAGPAEADREATPSSPAAASKGASSAATAGDVAPPSAGAEEVASLPNTADAASPPNTADEVVQRPAIGEDVVPRPATEKEVPPPATAADVPPPAMAKVEPASAAGKESNAAGKEPNGAITGAAGTGSSATSASATAGARESATEERESIPTGPEPGTSDSLWPAAWSDSGGNVSADRRDPNPNGLRPAGWATGLRSVVGASGAGPAAAPDRPVDQAASPAEPDPTPGGKDRQAVPALAAESRGRDAEPLPDADRGPETGTVSRDGAQQESDSAAPGRDGLTSVVAASGAEPNQIAASSDDADGLASRPADGDDATGDKPATDMATTAPAPPRPVPGKPVPPARPVVPSPARPSAPTQPSRSQTEPAEPTPAVPTPTVPTPAVPTPAVPAPAVPTPAGAANGSRPTPASVIARIQGQATTATVDSGRTDPLPVHPTQPIHLVMPGHPAAARAVARPLETGCDAGERTDVGSTSRPEVGSVMSETAGSVAEDALRADPAPADSGASRSRSGFSAGNQPSDTADGEAAETEATPNGSRAGAGRREMGSRLWAQAQSRVDGTFTPGQAARPTPIGLGRPTPAAWRKAAETVAARVAGTTGVRRSADEAEAEDKTRSDRTEPTKAAGARTTRSKLDGTGPAEVPATRVSDVEAAGGAKGETGGTAPGHPNEEPREASTAASGDPDRRAGMASAATGATRARSAAAKTETAAKTGTAAKIGSAAKTEEAAKTGTPGKTGAPAKSAAAPKGTTAKNGATVAAGPAGRAPTAARVGAARSTGTPPHGTAKPTDLPKSGSTAKAAESVKPGPAGKSADGAKPLAAKPSDVARSAAGRSAGNAKSATTGRTTGAPGAERTEGRPAPRTGVPGVSTRSAAIPARSAATARTATRAAATGRVASGDAATARTATRAAATGRVASGDAASGSGTPSEQPTTTRLSYKTEAAELLAGGAQRRRRRTEVQPEQPEERPRRRGSSAGD